MTSPRDLGPPCRPPQTRRETSPEDSSPVSHHLAQNSSGLSDPRKKKRFPASGVNDKVYLLASTENDFNTPASKSYSFDLNDNTWTLERDYSVFCLGVAMGPMVAFDMTYVEKVNL